jgi:hypothetical protein
MPRTLPSQVLRFIASIPVIAVLTAHPAAAAQQKPAPPSPHSQAQLEEHVKELEKRLDAAEQKAASAAMEKDYILHTQNHYESYYKEVFSTQTHILWTIGVTATLLSITLSVVFFLAGRFGFNIFDRRIDLSLKEASAQLRTEFNQQLRTELETLRKENAQQVKQLEDNLTHRIAELEADLARRITEQEQDLKARSDYQFHFAQGIGVYVNATWGPAIKQFRQALLIYKKSKPRNLFEKHQGNRTTANIFLAIRARDKEKFDEAAKKELALDVYKDLEDELAFAANEVPELTPLLQKN